jgi:hypothetical protein
LAQKPWSKMSTICITETPGLQKYFKPIFSYCLVFG